MGIADRARVAWALLRLEWWLEWYGAPNRVYRPMRLELASNLREAAAAPGGVRASVRRLGSPRSTAREAALGDARFRWERGLVWALLTFAVLTLVHVALSVAFAQGLLVGGGGQGRVLGSEVTASATGTAVTGTLVLPWWPVMTATLVFVLGSTPWRYRGRRPVAA